MKKIMFALKGQIKLVGGCKKQFYGIAYSNQIAFDFCFK
jgi:hypothetical protein